jgi:hypothetical protein
MFKHEIETTAPETLTDDQLELIAGGIIIDGMGNICTCPNFPPVVLDSGSHSPLLVSHVGCSRP